MVKIEVVVDSINKNKHGECNLKVVAPYESIAEYVQLFSMLNLNLRITIEKDAGEVELATDFRIKNINTKKEGDAVLVFYGTDIDFDNIIQLVGETVTIGVY